MDKKSKIKEQIKIWDFGVSKLQQDVAWELALPVDEYM